MSIAELSEPEEEFVVAAPRRPMHYTTNATTTFYEEDFTPPTSGTYSEPELGATLGELRIGDSSRTQSLWYVMYRAFNEVARLSDIETPGTDLTHTANHAATEAFASTVADFVSVRPTERPTCETDDSQVGTFRVHHEREVIFSREVEFHLQQLPRWKPRIALDRRTIDTDDD